MRDAGTLLGVPIDRASLDSVVLQSLSAVDGASAQVVFACANPHSLVVAQQDRAFHRALTQANIVVADGVGVTALAKVARVAVGPRITGTDYFTAMMRSLQQRGQGRVFFFGSSQRVLDLIAQRFVRDYPNLELVGVLSPPFRQWCESENEAMVAKITGANPDVLWVGMTAPKQEKWVQENRGKLRVPVIGSIGAVFDFYAGTYPRAPQWICKLGIEWVYRLIKEPGRMWRRNFVSTPVFVAMVFWRHALGIGRRFEVQ